MPVNKNNYFPGLMVTDALVGVIGAVVARDWLVAKLLKSSTPSFHRLYRRSEKKS